MESADPVHTGTEAMDDAGRKRLDCHLNDLAAKKEAAKKDAQAAGDSASGYRDGRIACSLSRRSSGMTRIPTITGRSLLAVEPASPQLLIAFGRLPSSACG